MPTSRIPAFINRAIERDLRYGEPVRRAAGLAAVISTSPANMAHASTLSGVDSYTPPRSERAAAPTPGNGGFASSTVSDLPSLPTDPQPSERATGSAVERFVRTIFGQRRARHFDNGARAGHAAARFWRNDTTGIPSTPQDTPRIRNNARVGGATDAEETATVTGAGPASLSPSANYRTFTLPPQDPVR